MRRLRLRWVKWLAWSHTSGKWQHYESDKGILTLLQGLRSLGSITASNGEIFASWKKYEYKISLGWSSPPPHMYFSVATAFFSFRDFAFVVIEGEIFLFTDILNQWLLAHWYVVVALTEPLGDTFNLEIPLLFFLFTKITYIPFASLFLTIQRLPLLTIWLEFF